MIDRIVRVICGAIIALAIVELVVFLVALARRPWTGE